MTDDDLEPIAMSDDVDRAPHSRGQRPSATPATALAVIATLVALLAAVLAVTARQDLQRRAEEIEAVGSQQDTLTASLESQGARIDVLERQRLLTTVPNVEGLDLGVAQRVLTGAMLTGVVDPNTPPGRTPVVVRQDPPAGTETTRGMRVALYLEDR
jgi:hypothetical protein